MPKQKVKSEWFDFFEELMADKPREFVVSLYPDVLEPEPIADPDKWRDDVLYFHITCTRTDFPKHVARLHDKYPGKIIRHRYTGEVIRA